MKIAVTSQNRRTITEHAGKCRNFWIYTVQGGKVVHKELMELPQSAAFKHLNTHEPHPLEFVNLLITRGVGAGLIQRLEHYHIRSIITDLEEPDQAVAAFLAGTLEAQAPNPQHHHAKGHHHAEGEEPLPLPGGGKPHE